jgi:hypothetical protein
VLHLYNPLIQLYHGGPQLKHVSLILEVKELSRNQKIFLNESCKKIRQKLISGIIILALSKPTPVRRQINPI